MPLMLLLLLTSICFAGEPYFLAAETVQSRFSKLHSKNDERALELRELFKEAGCDSKNYSEEKIQSSKLPNLVCDLAGPSKKTVVVSAHFDNRGPGEGAIDNWSGAALLPSLFESLKTSTHKVTFRFIGFTDEEKGLIGSRDYVNHLSKEQRADILLDVNIDSVGLPGPLRVWAGRADNLLLNFAAIVADRTKLFVAATTLDQRYDSDATAFLAWNIPAIDFFALNGETLTLLHSKQDVRTALDPASYYNDYKFLVAYLEYLDGAVETGTAFGSPAN